MNPSIFRPNDIRGIVDRDFTTADFILIGQGYAKFLLDRGARKAVVGRDNRIHSANLQAALIQGLLSSGVDVVDLGEVTTPMVYFARHHLKVPGGV
ncbi:MAG TPA: phosphomannomutase, partial [Patescibacteria group bacterium]|nr:phosphomannomutase [Patescibacteria group bacterium]